MKKVGNNASLRCPCITRESDARTLIYAYNEIKKERSKPMSWYINNLKAHTYNAASERSANKVYVWLRIPEICCEHQEDT